MVMHSQSDSLFSSSLLPTPAQTAQVHQLLRSNSVPSDSQSSYLRSIIAPSLADVARYDIEIERLQAERDALQRYCDECRSVYAPVRRLPPEILAEIFLLCVSPTPILYCDDTQNFPDGPNPATQPHLLPLLQVCLSWYNTVMTTPCLWANIEAALHNTSSKLLARSLDRSARCPLTLHLEAYDGNLQPALELLGGCADRWRIADLYISEDAGRFLSHVRGNLPRLERLGLGGGGAPGIEIFETAPNLTHIVLSRVGSPLPKLPWTQLREVTYYYSSGLSSSRDDAMVDHLGSMSRCSSQCEFNLYDLDVSDFTVPISALASVRVQSDIPILRLAILDVQIEEHSRQALGEILRVLTLPRLQLLHFHSPRPERFPLFWPRDDFLALASRSSFRNTLNKLFLHDLVITQDELVGCLSDMKVLRELFIQDVPGDFSTDHRRADHILITDSLLQRLGWRPDSSCLVPHMHHFSFGSKFSFEDNAFIEFVDSRLVSGATRDAPFRIDAFRVTDTPNPVRNGLDDAAIARMTALENQGLLRWSQQDREDLRKKLEIVTLF
ncbi:hypothetical protein K438DRAFT_1735247 [Mycena galopus ATCC 62051]|nr:hypothetical protein K438DRAFT_1735247 [Mycena galopus ATCC 62051]